MEVKYINSTNPLLNNNLVKIDRKVCLICIDGWGVSSLPLNKLGGDAVFLANTPIMDALCQESNNSSLAAHGRAVGLPDGLMGNSEVGHLNIGAGRVVYQDIVRIDLSVETEYALNNNLTIKTMFNNIKNNRLHLIGLISDGGVHSHQKHLYALLKVAKEFGIKNTFIHIFTDGRDTSPKSAINYINQLQDEIKKLGYGKISSICGRYYAMDRDNRNERTELALKMLLHGFGEKVKEELICEKIESRYLKGETDEFLRPIVIINNEEEEQSGFLRNNDSIFFFNYRSDRMRQLCTCFLSENIEKLPKIEELINNLEEESFHYPNLKYPIKSLDIASMTQYKSTFPFPVAFPPQSMENVLAETLSKQGIKQCHIAETEKYAHVTFFFNGGCEKEFPGEDRVLIPSPKVSTYDLKPEMSSLKVGLEVDKAIKSGEYPFIMCNFAPPDMVGHTGKLNPAIEAVSATDLAIGVILKSCKDNGYTLVVTADHGNVEKMINEIGEPHTAHTTSRVPIYISPIPSLEFIKKVSTLSALCDVAPTILKIMGLNIPVEMNGNPLI